MTTQVSTKVRLVRCPKCRQVLAELPDVRLYKCGGCGTVLQAKPRNVEVNRSDSTASVASVQQDNAPEEEEARSSNHDLSSLQNGDSLKENGDTNHNTVKTRNVEVNCSDSTDSVAANVQQDNAPEEEDRSSNHDLSSLQNGDSLKESDDIDHQHEHLDSETASPEGNSCEAENSTVEVNEPSRHDEEAEERASDTNHDLDDHTGADNSEVGESQRLCQEGDDVVDRDENMPENGYQENDRPPSGGENGEGRRHRHVSLEKEEKACSADENGVLHGEVGHVGLDSSPAQILSHDNVDASHLPEPSTEVDGDLEEKLSASVVDSGVESHDYGHLYRPMRKFRQNFGSASSLSTLGSSPHAKRPTSELRLRHGDVRRNFAATRNYYGYDGSESSYDNDQSPQRISHPSQRNGTTVKKLDEMPSSEPGMNYSNLPFTDASESPSIYKRNLIPRHPGFRSLDDTPDEMELLRTVQDLKDQLNRIQILRAERQMYADASPPRYHHLHNQERRNTSRLAFSGEAAHFRHQINCSCLHGCPQDLHRSAQLPSGYCGVHTGCSRCNVSSFSTPEQSLRTHEMQLNELRHRDREMQRLSREKYHTARKHIRPMAGGAPVVPCYHCSQLLQLPAEFLLSKKRYHQLKCGACGKMLSFSLLRNKHIVPHFPENYNQRNFGSTSDSSQHVDHVSCDQSGRNKNRNMLSGSSYDLTRDTRMKSIMNEDMDLVESYESLGASSGKSKAASSESEKVKGSPDSRLHRLMGYESARHILNK